MSDSLRDAAAWSWRGWREPVGTDQRPQRPNDEFDRAMDRDGLARTPAAWRTECREG